MEKEQFRLVALQVNQLQKELDEGNINEDEYRELVQSVGALKAIESDTSNLEDNLQYRQIIINAIAVAKLLA
jgi:hypothetical protein